MNCVLQLLYLVGIYLILLLLQLLLLRQLSLVGARRIFNLVYPFLELRYLVIQHRLLVLHLSLMTVNLCETGLLQICDLLFLQENLLVLLLDSLLLR